MKHSLRKLALSAVIAFTASVATIPAHATLSGSEPRPQYSAGGGQTFGYYVYAAMAVLGF